jgi:dihydrofolate reductase
MIRASRAGPNDMSQVTSHISISLDGYVAGPNQSPENPVGEGGMRLHEWMFATAGWRAHHGSEGGEHNVDSDVIARATEPIGAYIMGRNMFDAGRGPWDPEWRGWWGEDPPFHAPVFVLTHHPREPLSMLGGTTFTFVTTGIEAALEQGRAAAGDRNVAIPGGARTVQQYLAAGLLDELQLHIVPVLLGAGERLLENVGDPVLEPVEVVASPAVTHVRYRVAGRGD